MNHPQRLHALDNLRAIMMWLGIVLHVAIQHIVQESPLPWRDRETTAFADLLVIFIHAYRMPVFFMMAGFFTAMLASRRGYYGMMKHRMRRIGLPFLVFWPILFVALVVLALLFVHLATFGTLGMMPEIMPTNTGRPIINTMHMWFLYYLLLFCVLAVFFGSLGKFIPDPAKAKAALLWGILVSRWWGFLVLALPLAIVGSFYRHGLLEARGSFIPNLAELVHNGMFFVAGWSLYRLQDTLLVQYSRHWWRYLAAGLVFFIATLTLFETIRIQPGKIPHAEIWIAFLYNCTTWLWSFALIGIFIRFLGQKNTFLRYVSDSSYWVFMVHMLGTVGFGLLLYNTPFGAFTKMGINILATTVACVATYHLFVRRTFIGVLLNGRRVPLHTERKLDNEIPVA